MRSTWWPASPAPPPDGCPEPVPSSGDATTVHVVPGRAVTGLGLVMPMAGRGEREGFAVPKPLIMLEGRPFFWWAAESVRRAAPVTRMVFVVLDEHCAQFDLHERILDHYPGAAIVRLPDVTAGAAETALLGVRALAHDGPIAVNDCDHAFECSSLASVVQELEATGSAALLCFHSDSPAHSYVRLDPLGRVTGTLEKQVVSPYAIAGCYLFAGSSQYLWALEAFRQCNPYPELFVSGLYNALAEAGTRILRVDLDDHRAFGTPEELERLLGQRFEPYARWR
jgi:CTP:molybdopterin cytidylyltransferase MocA